MDSLIFRSLTICASVASLTAPSLAHPHVLVELQSRIVVNAQGLIEGVDVDWTFDDGYAQTAIEGLDLDGDGELSSAELQPLTDENIASLKELGYFTFMRSKGVQLPISDVTQYAQDYTAGKLTLRFRVPLQTPLDPHSGEFALKVYDPEFFISFEYPADAQVAVQGALPSGCKSDLLPLKTDTEIEQTREVLASKDKDWKPEADEDLGGMFARAAVVTCAS